MRNSYFCHEHNFEGIENSIEEDEQYVEFLLGFETDYSLIDKEKFKNSFIGLIGHKKEETVIGIKSSLIKL